MAKQQRARAPEEPLGACEPRAHDLAVGRMTFVADVDDGRVGAVDYFSWLLAVTVQLTDFTRTRQHLRVRR